MRRSIVGALFVSSCGLLANLGCATTGSHVPAAATPEMTTAFDRLKALQGDWEMADPQTGKNELASSFRVTSAGSAVREIMFPGSPHEMTNVYHMDGDSLIATHYCAAGNQPRMRCTHIDGNVYSFVFIDITNLSSVDVEHMADLTMTLQDNDHLREDWSSRKDGVKTEHANFELTRIH